MKYTIITILLFACSITVTYAQNVGIGTATPATSAQLDISSTTKGFLPPRMNTSARDAIVSPVAGLTIYNTSTQALEFWNGTAWISTGSTAPAIHTIGESFGGGTVFYTTPNGLHGLIAETQDQGYSNWYGALNSVSISSNHSTAAQNYTDWRLPTKNELDIMYQHQALVGGFGFAHYWCSTENDGSTGWYLVFVNGNQSYESKGSLNLVRSVRAF